MSDIRKIIQQLDEMTSAGAVAPVAMPMGEVHKRSKDEVVEDGGPEKAPKVSELEWGNWKNAKLAGVNQPKKAKRVSESADVTDYNPKSQGGTRKELLAKYHKTKDPKDAEAARKAGATQRELKGVAEVAPVRIGSKLPQSDTETFGLERGRGYKINTPKDWKPGDRPRAMQQLIPTQDKKDHIRSRLGKHKSPVLPEQDVAEGYDDEDPGNPVMDAIIGRIMRTRPDLLDYDMEKLQEVIRDVALDVGDVDEIGSSDISGWVKRVEQNLSGEQLDEINWKKAAATGAVALGALGGLGASGSAQARVMQGPDGQMSPSFAQQMAQQTQQTAQTGAEKVERSADGIVVHYDGKEYKGVLVPKDGPTPRGAKMIKITQAQMGERGIGSYTAYLMPNGTAYIYKLSGQSTNESVTEGFNSDLEMELHQLTKSPDMYDAIYNALERNDKLGSHLQDMMYDVARENRLHPDDDIEKIIDIMADHLAADYGDPDLSEERSVAEADMTEATPRLVDRRGNPIKRPEDDGWQLKHRTELPPQKTGSAYHRSGGGVVTKTDIGLIHQARGDQAPTPRRVKDEELEEEKQGLWANIHAKRERIKRGSGERMRKPGSKGAPTAQNFKAARKG